MVQLKIIFLFILPRQTPSVLHIHFHNLLLRQGVVWGFTLLVLSPWELDSYLQLPGFHNFYHKQQTVKKAKRSFFILVVFIDIQECPRLYVTVPICTYVIPYLNQMKHLAVWNNFWLTGPSLRERGWEFIKVM